jgi:hypothetical protein
MTITAKSWRKSWRDERCPLRQIDLDLTGNPSIGQQGMQRFLGYLTEYKIYSAVVDDQKSTLIGDVHES